MGLLFEVADEHTWAHATSKRHSNTQLRCASTLRTPTFERCWCSEAPHLRYRRLKCRHSKACKATTCRGSTDGV
eukprot:6179949-Pleurochrysis_carterae.AAC.1